MAVVQCVYPGIYVCLVRELPPPFVIEAVVATCAGSESLLAANLLIKQEVQGGLLYAVRASCGCCTTIILFQVVTDDN